MSCTSLVSLANARSSSVNPAPLKQMSRVAVASWTALVGSANLTSRAMETNLECGILIRGGRSREPSASTSMDFEYPVTCAGFDSPGIPG
jgi:hypothetical protein